MRWGPPGDGTGNEPVQQQRVLHTRRPDASHGLGKPTAMPWVPSGTSAKGARPPTGQGQGQGSSQAALKNPIPSRRLLLYTKAAQAMQLCSKGAPMNDALKPNQPSLSHQVQSAPTYGVQNGLGDITNKYATSTLNGARQCKTFAALQPQGLSTVKPLPAGGLNPSYMYSMTAAPAAHQKGSLPPSWKPELQQPKPAVQHTQPAAQRPKPVWNSRAGNKNVVSKQSRSAVPQPTLHTEGMKLLLSPQACDACQQPAAIPPEGGAIDKKTLQDVRSLALKQHPTSNTALLLSRSAALHTAPAAPATSKVVAAKGPITSKSVMHRGRFDNGIVNNNNNNNNNKQASCVAPSRPAPLKPARPLGQAAAANQAVPHTAPAATAAALHRTRPPAKPQARPPAPRPQAPAQAAAQPNAATTTQPRVQPQHKRDKQTAVAPRPTKQPPMTTALGKAAGPSLGYGQMLAKRQAQGKTATASAAPAGGRSSRPRSTPPASPKHRKAAAARGGPGPQPAPEPVTPRTFQLQLPGGEAVELVTMGCCSVRKSWKQLPDGTKRLKTLQELMGFDSPAHSAASSSSLGTMQVPELHASDFSPLMAKPSGPGTSDMWAVYNNDMACRLSLFPEYQSIQEASALLAAGRFTGTPAPGHAAGRAAVRQPQLVGTVSSSSESHHGVTSPPSATRTEQSNQLSLFNVP